MKLGVMMCAYHEESKIQPSISQFVGLVDEVRVEYRDWETDRKSVV